MYYKFIRALNNNAVLATRDDGPEVILMGKGIGFGSPGSIDPKSVDRAYILSDYRDKSAYIELLGQGDPDVFEAVSEIIFRASETLGDLHPSIFPVLSGHVDFAIRRVRQGMAIENPLLPEIKSLYQDEYHVAVSAIELLNDRLGITLLAEEAGYIALHLGAARTNQDIKSALRMTNAINDAIAEIEKRLQIDFEPGPLYRQTVEFLRRLVQQADEARHVKNILLPDIRRLMPYELDMARAISQRLASALEREIPEDEIGYFAIHLHYLQAVAQK